MVSKPGMHIAVSQTRPIAYPAHGSTDPTSMFVMLGVLVHGVWAEVPGTSKSRMLTAATRGLGASMVTAAAVASNGSGSGAPAPSEAAPGGPRAGCEEL